MSRETINKVIAGVTETIAEYNLFRKGETIIIGVSGGPDSVALLDILHHMSKERGWNIIVAHLNHMIRDKEAKRDEKFVKDLAAGYGLTCVVESADIPGFAKKMKLSIETAGREQRYSFFKYISEQHGGTKVATAHTMDDQAETILLRILRGTGMRGLRGIFPIRRIHPQSKVLIVRPLLTTSKDEILAYLKARKVSFCRDSTNDLNDYMRNKVRNKLIPQLRKEFNGEISVLLAHLAKQSQDMYSYFESEMHGTLQRLIIDQEPRRVILDANHLQREQVFMQTNIVSHVITMLKEGSPGLTFKHYQDILKLLDKPGSDSFIKLPGKITLRKEYDKLIVIVGDEQETVFKEKFIKNLAIPGITLVPEFGLEIKTEVLDFSQFDLVSFMKNKTQLEEIIDHDKLTNALTVRLRKEGDVVKPLGLDGSKKVKKLMIDKKIPVSKRDSIPMITSGNDIIWVLGVQLDRRYCVTSSTRNLIKITASHLKLV